MECTADCAATIAAAAEGDKEDSQTVQVAVHVRPLILQEQLNGCKECISAVPNQPQVQLGSHIFTFDHVYGSNASSPSGIFDECVAPLVDGLFHGYNATVLAYGQTGSGKTYTMGTGGNAAGIIHRVMETLFAKVEQIKDKAEVQLRVSFIEILKEDIHDLLDTSTPPAAKPEPFAAVFGVKAPSPTKPSILIRETSSGGITLSGVTEISVTTLQGMASCLEEGSSSRATGSTNMNSTSSRSHAIFTINMEQRTKSSDGVSEEFLCAKLHLVDLAGSERAKRTGTDGLRFKEGVHINKGLLALGNVISALGDDKKRKEGGHVPYRDSKLTRLLQDSLGGNSRTVMIACVSPADFNAEETLNTLKYANRARNIQNKAIVNRDPATAEIQRLKQQVEVLQSQLLCGRAESFSDQIEILKQKVAWLEARNTELCEELQQFRDDALPFHNRNFYHKSGSGNSDDVMDREGSAAEMKTRTLLGMHAPRVQELETELQQLRPSLPNIALEVHLPCINGIESVPSTNGIESERIEDMSTSCDLDTRTKELEHSIIQDNLDKELQELNRKLAQKEAEMKTFTISDSIVLKERFERKLEELEEEKRALQKERDILIAELQTLATVSDAQTQKMQESYVQKLKQLEDLISDLKRRQDKQAQILKQKQKNEEAAKKLYDDIHRIKQQKVHLQQKIKQESEQFRVWKTAREKELMQLKKEGRRNEYEMHKLRALHQHQRMVLQRKTEEAAAATRRLKEVLESRKPSLKETSAAESTLRTDHKSLQTLLNHELQVAWNIYELRLTYDKQKEAHAALASDLAKRKMEMLLESETGPQDTSKISMLESMLRSSSEALVSVASQLSEAEERDLTTGRWLHVKSLADAKTLLDFAVEATVCARRDVRNMETEILNLKDRNSELTEMRKLNETRKNEFERHQRLKEQAVAVALAAATKAGADIVVRCGMEELSLGFSQLAASGSPHVQQYSEETGMTASTSFHAGKLWKWRQSQQQRCSLHFKWKWQKPWKLSEWGMGKGVASHRYDMRHRHRWKRIKA